MKISVPAGKAPQFDLRKGTVPLYLNEYQIRMLLDFLDGKKVDTAEKRAFKSSLKAVMKYLNERVKT